MSTILLQLQQGITLRSLGGIFLATLVGLALSMITLAYEVWQQKKEERNQVKAGFDQPVDKNQILVVGSKHIPIGGKNGLGFYSGIMDDYPELPPITGNN